TAHQHSADARVDRVQQQRETEVVVPDHGGERKTRRGTPGSCHACFLPRVSDAPGLRETRGSSLLTPGSPLTSGLPRTDVPVAHPTRLEEPGPAGGFTPRSQWRRPCRIPTGFLPAPCDGRRTSSQKRSIAARTHATPSSGGPAHVDVRDAVLEVLLALRLEAERAVEVDGVDLRGEHRRRAGDLGAGGPHELAP